MYYKLDKDHNIVKTDILDKDAFNIANRRVAETTLPNGKWISTVFLTIDHSFGSGPPILFESMVFAGKESSEDLTQRRYCTWEEAVKGHEELVKEYS